MQGHFPVYKVEGKALSGLGEGTGAGVGGGARKWRPWDSIFPVLPPWNETPRDDGDSQTALGNMGGHTHLYFSEHSPGSYNGNRRARQNVLRG